MLRLLDVLAVQVLHLSGKLSDELLLDILMDKDIVRGDAGLAGVEGLAPGYAAGCNLEVGRAVNDAGALAAQFQYDGSQVLGCSGHNLAAQSGTAGKEYDIPSAAEQLLVDIAVSLNHSDVVLVEHRPDHLLQYGRYVRNVGRRLEHSGAAGRYGTHQRV